MRRNGIEGRELRNPRGRGSAGFDGNVRNFSIPLAGEPLAARRKGAGGGGPAVGRTSSAAPGGGTPWGWRRASPASLPGVGCG